LTITAASGLAMVGSLNLISVAFAVLFVGLGVDFAIQFAVRYRDERYRVPAFGLALQGAAVKIGAPLTLAAAAVACGFLSFVPTAYAGVSELGLIAGAGMIIAYARSMTMLAGVVAVFNRGGEPERVGYRALAPVDKFLQEHRIAVVVGTIAIAAAGLPLVYHLSFDFNPIHLRSTRVESVATLLDLQGDPRAGTNAINVTAANLNEAKDAAERLRKAAVWGCATHSAHLVQPDRPHKLPFTTTFPETPGRLLRPKLLPPPTEEETFAPLTDIPRKLNKSDGSAAGPGPLAAPQLAA